MITSTKSFSKKRKRQTSSRSVDRSNNVGIKRFTMESETSTSKSEEISKTKKKKKKQMPSTVNNIQSLNKSGCSEFSLSIKEKSSKIEAFSKKKRRQKSTLQKVEPSSESKGDQRTVFTKEISPPKDKVAPLKSSGFCWNADPKLLAEIVEPSHVSDSSEEEDENVSKKKKKRQSVAEKKEAAKKEEERLRAVEENLASNTNLPSSCDEFDRAVLANPDSSELWLQYMAFHLQATEIEKARGVAQRALDTISYRKEQEKFNIWVGLLNLENLYGSQESLKKTLLEALQLNDAYKVRVQMINIYSENGKLQELESEVKLVVKKFHDVKGMWLEIGTILYKHGLIEQARRLLQQGLAAQRNKNETVSLISRFAMMEAKFGEMERSLALFDSILVSHPQRVDVWSVCVDQLCKAGMIDQARSTLERAISQKLKSRWMKNLFAKYLTFEEKYGTPEGSERVREKAREYVEKVSGEKLKD